MWVNTAAFGTAMRMRASISSDRRCARDTLQRSGTSRWNETKRRAAGVPRAKGVEGHALLRVLVEHFWVTSLSSCGIAASSSPPPSGAPGRRRSR